MRSAEDNTLLTESGQGTPMGELLRPPRDTFQLRTTHAP